MSLIGISRSSLCCFFSLLKPLLVVSLFELKLMSLYRYEYFSSLSTQFECLLICGQNKIIYICFPCCMRLRYCNSKFCVWIQRDAYSEEGFLGVSCVLEFSSLSVSTTNENKTRVSNFQ